MSRTFPPSSVSVPVLLNDFQPETKINLCRREEGKKKQIYKKNKNIYFVSLSRIIFNVGVCVYAFPGNTSIICIFIFLAENAKVLHHLKIQKKEKQRRAIQRECGRQKMAVGVELQSEGEKTQNQKKKKKVYPDSCLL